MDTTKLTPQVALQNLYQASTLAKLTAQEHQMLVESANVLEKLIDSKISETKTEPSVPVTE